VASFLEPKHGVIQSVLGLALLRRPRYYHRCRHLTSIIVKALGVCEERSKAEQGARAIFEASIARAQQQDYRHWCCSFFTA
jgi:hypothetical protein